MIITFIIVNWFKLYYMFLISIIEKVSLSLITKLISKKLLDRSENSFNAYQAEMQNILDKVLIDFRSKYDISDKRSKFNFIKSARFLEKILENIFTIEDFRENELQSIIDDDNIIPPSSEQLDYFFERLKIYIQSSFKLHKLKIEYDFKDEIFKISSKADTILEKMNDQSRTLQSIVDDTKSRVSNIFRGTLTKIEDSLKNFQVLTAYSLLIGLEEDLERSYSNDKKITARINYLKATCLQNAPELSDVNFNTLFIKSYNLDRDNKTFRRNACTAYYNLKEFKKAKLLAESILSEDEFDLTAWIIKTIMFKDIKQGLKNIPESVKNNPIFNNSIAHYLTYNAGAKSLQEIENIGIIIDLEKSYFKELNIFNKFYWDISIFLLYNKVLFENPRLYLSGDDFSINKTENLELLIEILQKYVGIITKSELKDSIKYSEFLLEYFRYRITKDSHLIGRVLNLYEHIKFDALNSIQVVQILNHQEKYKESLKILNSVTDINDFYYGQIQIYKCINYKHINEINESIETFKTYLGLEYRINLLHYQNILIMLDFCFDNVIDNETFNELIALVTKKEYESQILKEICSIHCNLKFQNEISLIDLKTYKENLIAIKFDTPEELKFLLIESLLLLKDFESILQVIPDFNEILEISPYLEVYIQTLYALLQEESVEQNDLHAKLLKALDFWRLNSENINYDFLFMEFNLHHALSDWQNCYVITTILYDSNPQNEQFIHLHLKILNKLKATNEIEKIAKNIPEKFENENYGLSVVSTINNYGFEEQRVFNILYHLAVQEYNHNARLFYISQSFKISNSAFKKYDYVKEGEYVEYKIDDELFVEYVSSKNIIINEKVQTEVYRKIQFTNELKTISIVDCYNKYVKLQREIFKEAANPTNSLGMQQFQIDTLSKESFHNQLKKIIGTKGDEEEKFRKKQFNKYKKYELGFSSLVFSVFDGDYIQAYYYLTSQEDFRILPYNFYPKIHLTDDTKFVIDFPTILLLFNLEKNHEIEFKQSFIVSNLIIEHIDNLIDTERNSPEPKLSVKVTSSSVVPIFKPENYQEKRLLFLSQIKNWVVNNCKIEIVKEKLDLILKLDSNAQNNYFQIYIDNAMLSQRDNHVLISSDLDIIRGFKNNHLAILALEEFFNKYHINSIDKIYKTFLENRYVGITFPEDIIFDEFLKFIALDKNNFNHLLISLGEWINPYESKIEEISNLIRRIYLISSITIEKKDEYVLRIILAVLQGASESFRIVFYKSLTNKLSLLGFALDHVKKIYIYAEVQLFSFSLNYNN